MKRLCILSLILLSLWVAGCDEASTAPTRIVVTTSPSPLDTATPTTTATAIPANVTPTRLRPTPTPTRDVLAEAGEVLSGFSIEKSRIDSPDGRCNWQRLTADPSTEEAMQKYGGMWFKYVTMQCSLEEQGEVEWVLVKAWEEMGLGYALPAFLGWSADGKFAYVEEATIPDGCQPLGGFQQNVQQVELETGKVHPIPIEPSGGVTLSPNALKIAFYDWQNAQVGVYDLVAGTEQRAAIELPQGIEEWYAGDFTWSPDSLSVLFVVQYGEACFPTGASLRRYEVQTNEVSRLLERSDEADVRIVEWSEGNRARVRIGEEEWWVEVETGEMVKP